MYRVIKRYENRKLYDTQDKRYVSLQEVAGLVRAGDEVTVLENETGADITAQTLSKIITDESSKHLPLLRRESLHEMVRWGGKMITGSAGQVLRSLDRTLEASLERLGLGRQTREEMTRLRQRIEGLESLVTKLRLEVRHEHNDNATSTGSRPERGTTH